MRSKVLYLLLFFLVLISVVILRWSIFLPSDRSLDRETSSDIDLSWNQIEYATQPLPMKAYKNMPVMSPFSFETRGAIFPHDTLPEELTKNFLTNIAEHTQPSTIILIGPDHKLAGESEVTTSSSAWEFKGSSITPHASMIKKLVDLPFNALNDDVIRQEHSMTNVLPLLMNSFPDSQVVPIIVSNYISQEHVDTLVEFLYTEAPADSIYIAAIDFSHETNNQTSMERDQATIGFMEDSNYSAIRLLDNTFLDAPGALVLYLKLMDRYNTGDFFLAGNTSSSFILNQLDEMGTSYIYAAHPK